MNNWEQEKKQNGEPKTKTEHITENAMQIIRQEINCLINKSEQSVICHQLRKK